MNTLMMRCSYLWLVIFCIVIVQGRNYPCSETPTFANGKALRRKDGRVVSYKCRRNYNRIGKKFALCSNGVWSVPPPICIRAGCGDVKPTSGLIIKKAHNGAMLKFHCPAGKTRLGPGSLHCNGTTWNSDPPKCVGVSKLECDFEDENLCGWSQSINDNFEWQWHRGRTATPKTGPNFDHTYQTKSKSGHYVYIDASSPRKVGDRAVLMSPIYVSQSDVCFMFWYHMYGHGMGKLEVFIRKQRQRLIDLQPSVKLVGNQGRRWKKQNVTIGNQDKAFQIVFVGTVGETTHGDIAIDDVRFYKCSDLKEPLDTRTTAKITPEEKMKTSSAGYEKILHQATESPNTKIIQSTTPWKRTNTRDMASKQDTVTVASTSQPVQITSRNGPSTGMSPKQQTYSTILNKPLNKITSPNQLVSAVTTSRQWVSTRPTSSQHVPTTVPFYQTVPESTSNQPVSTTITAKQSTPQETASEQPIYREISSNHPELTDTSSDQPELPNTSSNQPELSSTSSSQPGLSRTVSDRTLLITTTTDHPVPTGTMSNQPVRTRTASTQPVSKRTTPKQPRETASALAASNKPLEEDQRSFTTKVDISTKIHEFHQSAATGVEDYVDVSGSGKDTENSGIDMEDTENSGIDMADTENSGREDEGREGIEMNDQYSTLVTRSFEPQYRPIFQQLHRTTPSLNDENDRPTYTTTTFSMILRNKISTTPTIISDNTSFTPLDTDRRPISSSPVPATSASRKDGLININGDFFYPKGTSSSYDDSPGETWTIDPKLPASEKVLRKEADSENSFIPKEAEKTTVIADISGSLGSKSHNNSSEKNESNVSYNESKVTDASVSISLPMVMAMSLAVGLVAAVIAIAVYFWAKRENREMSKIKRIYSFPV